MKDLRFGAGVAHNLKAGGGGAALFASISNWGNAAATAVLIATSLGRASLEQLTELRGADVGVLAEEAAEVVLAGEVQLAGDLLDQQAGVGQHLPGQVQPGLLDVLVRRRPTALRNAARTWTRSWPPSR